MSSTKQSNLLAALQRKSTTSTTSQTGTSSSAASPKSSSPVATAPAPSSRKEPKEAEQRKRRVGKPVQFWLHEEDRQLIRELSAWLAGQGIRPTDSMVVRAALRMTKTGSGLVEAYRKASQLDGRLKHSR